ncbi:MAG: GGDEF domain-containing protein [Gammaproteobacteria bacterium]|nr:GGDEF domain-containing protein [Gammaproteobacteria bacterium]
MNTTTKPELHQPLSNSTSDTCENYHGKEIYQDDIFVEQVKLLYTGSVYRPLLHIIPAFFIYLLAYGYMPVVHTAIWLMILFVINIMRYFDIRRTQHVLEQADNFVLIRNRFARYTFALGTTYGLGAVYFSLYMPDINQLLFLTLLGTLTYPAVISFASDRLTFFSFFLPVLIPISIQHMLWGNLLHLYIGLGALLYIVVIGGYFSWHRNILIDAMCHRIASTDHINKLMHTNEELLELSSTDTLTGIANRRQFDFTLDREWRRMKRSRSDLSLLLVDIDYFDKFNEVYGEQKEAGCLQSVAHAIVECCRRPLDMPVRYGGYQFAVLLPDTNMENSLVVARKIRSAIEALSIENVHSPHEGLLTVSIGVSSSELRRTHTGAELIELAKESVDLSRRNKGNSIITAGPVPA